MREIPIGARGQIDLLVTSEVAIDFMGVEDARVLATPHLVWNLEWACHRALAPFLDEGEDSVGADVQVRHLAATPMGMSARFLAEVIAVDGRRVRFKVEAHDEKEKISEGTHERVVVNVSKFAARVKAKAAS
jgi:fluoroacetyl-CoA thioesterase